MILIIFVEGQYALKVSLGGLDDFLDEGNLEAFSLIEQAGNVMPYFDFQFTTSVKEILDYINEGTILNVGMGRTVEELIDVPLITLRKYLARVGRSKYKIRLIGLYDNIAYLTNSQITISDKIVGTQAIEDIANKYWKVVNEAKASSDSQYWIQNNLTDRNYLNDIWIHTHIPSSFPLVGITSTGEFIIKDLKTLAKAEPAFNLVSHPVKPEDIVIDSDYVVDSNTGLMNQWYGYGRKRRVWKAEEGMEEIQEIAASPILSQATKLDRSVSAGWRAAEAGILNENVHENYHISYLNNMQNLALFSSSTLGINTSREFYPIKVLDLIHLHDQEISEGGQKEGAEPAEKTQGSYLVSGVTRTLSGKKLVTYVKVNRECLSNLKGAMY